MTPVNEPVVELDGVTKEYPGSPAVRALDGVDLRIDRGELVSIVGPSGSGKSTLLNIVGLLDVATAGRVRIAGRDVTGLRDRELSSVRARSLGFVFQQFNLVAGMRAIDNVANGLLYRGIATAERRRIAGDALDRVGLSTRKLHRPEQLSGGERQRVAIARAIVGEPASILADEPTGNLDSKTGREILGLLLDLHAAGSTVIIITHDVSIAERTDRVVTVRDGRIEDDQRWGGDRSSCPAPPVPVVASTGAFG
jgi:putative ABC transport system ATP-binding protein